MRDILAVVVTYRSNDVLEACLRSLRAATQGPDSLDLNIVVVDTEQSRDTQKLVRTFDSVEYMSTPNKGYGSGLNAGMRLYDSNFILCSNADVYYHDGAVATLRSALTKSGAAVAGPRTLNVDGSVQPSKHGRPTPWTLVFSAWKVARGVRPMPEGLRRQYYAEHVADTGVGPVDWLNGHALLFRRDALERVGGWDESFFLYYEDVDVCLRLAGRGERCLYVGSAVVSHVQGVSTERYGSFWHRHYRQSKVRGIRRHVGFFWAIAMLLIFALHSVLPYAIHVLQRLLERIYLHRATAK